MNTPYDGLVGICEQAIADTYRWERGTRRFTWAFRVLVVVNVVFAGITIAMGSWFAILNVLATALMVYMLHRNKAHLEWVLATRVKWQTDLDKYQIERMTYVENGYRYDWDD